MEMYRWIIKHLNVIACLNSNHFLLDVHISEIMTNNLFLLLIYLNHIKTLISYNVLKLF